ncbi:MAG: 2-oxoglutarate dehydrogenase E1 component [Fimbriiglobus sp.]
MSSRNFADSYNRDFLEQEFDRWLSDPGSVEPRWNDFFMGFQYGGNTRPTVPQVTGDLRLQTGVVRLVNWYRQVGHFEAWIDPLAPNAPGRSPLLKLESYGLTEADLDKTVDASMIFGMNGSAKLSEVLELLRQTYCNHVGVEFMHIDSLEKRVWLAEQMEPTRNKPALSRPEKYRIAMTLHYATLFEQFLHIKYVGQKRFSLEGGETMLSMMDAIVEACPAHGIEEVVIGMAHRGRLNVLANIMQKPPEAIFNEFEDVYMPESTKDGDGDVKYHMGFSADVTTSSGKPVHLSLTPNPSHLEIVNPVVEGRVRAKQRQFNDTERSRGLPVLIHGDAAFAGQGTVTETLNMMNLAGYRTGGTIHIVINNQIGFTTNPRDARSTQYCTDVAKFIQVPIFHVNGDDPESAVQVIGLAMQYRQKFKADVVIDLLCYRKYGHNEGDDPSFTQPKETKLIDKKKTPAEIYTNLLVTEGTLKVEEGQALIETFQSKLKTKQEKLKAEIKEGKIASKKMKAFENRWDGLVKDFSHAHVPTAITPATVNTITEAMLTVPQGFEWHPKVKGIIEKRVEGIRGGAKGVDWGGGEALAFGSLVLEGHSVRLSGQDCRRGTFSHRHSYYVDYTDIEYGKYPVEYAPLANLPGQAGGFEAYNSLLSEAAVLGFEYGYSLDTPEALVLWEAQFGDFANGAQVVIDQFIASGESKWNRSSGLVLLLPHGYEGNGPEHSSARLERFLQLCAEDNMQVCNFSTPANYFHALRRQLKRNFRKPLIVMTPKSLLRLDAAASPIAEFTEGRFQEVIADPTIDPANVERVVMCSGKVYYDLLAHRDKNPTPTVALVRLEQFYPWPEEQLRAELKKFTKAKEFVWCQEEPHNNGGWFFVDPRLRLMGIDAKYVGRDPGASPATGSAMIHRYEQTQLVEATFTKPAPYLVQGVKRG